MGRAGASTPVGLGKRSVQARVRRRVDTGLRTRVRRAQRARSTDWRESDAGWAHGRRSREPCAGRGASHRRRGPGRAGGRRSVADDARRESQGRSRARTSGESLDAHYASAIRRGAAASNLISGRLRRRLPLVSQAVRAVAPSFLSVSSPSTPHSSPSLVSPCPYEGRQATCEARYRRPIRPRDLCQTGLQPLQETASSLFSFPHIPAHTLSCSQEIKV